MNPHPLPKFQLPGSVLHPQFQTQKGSARNGYPSSDEFPPSSAWLGHAEHLNRLHPSDGNNVTAEIRPNAVVDQTIKGRSTEDTEVFDTLANPSCPPPPVGRDQDNFHPISTDNSNEATDSFFIKMFDAICINHPSQAKKRSSDTTATEGSSPRKLQCIPPPQRLPQTIKVSTYVPATYPFQQAMRDTAIVPASATTSATTTALTSFKESFDSAISFVESNPSQFSLGSQLTQLTEPDKLSPLEEVPDLGILHNPKQHVNTHCADATEIEVICKTGFSELLRAYCQTEILTLLRRPAEALAKLVIQS